MKTRPLAAVVCLSLIGACDSDSDLLAQAPVLVIEPGTIDFGEVVINDEAQALATLRNEGRGALTISAAELAAGSSADFTLVSFPSELGSNEEGELVVAYAPDVEGGDWGTVTLSTNQDDDPSVNVSVLASAVHPCIDIDPELLNFGTVASGESVTESFTVRAGCTGNLVISTARFPGNEEEAYAATLPSGVSWPYTVGNNTAIEIEVTFSPPDAAEWSGEIWFESNDPYEPTAAVRLVGNSDDPVGNEAPIVEITEPDVGEYFMDDREITLIGSVYDANEPSSNLTCVWSQDGTKLASADPDDAGVVAAAEKLAAADSTTIRLKCYDSEGESGEDSVNVTVWKAEEPVEYTISGGESAFEYFFVDDDITIELNGIPIFKDDNDKFDTLAPITFEAESGDILTISLVDQNPTEAQLDALILHWGTGATQPLNDALCFSSDYENPCYDGTYAGPWPNEVFTADYPIIIP